MPFSSTPEKFQQLRRTVISESLAVPSVGSACQPMWQPTGHFIVAEELRDSQRATQVGNIREAARALSALTESVSAPASYFSRFLCEIGAYPPSGAGQAFLEMR
jgi:hypothetical protein